MPRIPPRTDPYSSPVRRQRHFKAKRDHILRQLCKASYINTSHFAIIWANSRGEVETHASDAFRSRLKDWFHAEILAEAKALALGTPTNETDESFCVNNGFKYDAYETENDDGTSSETVDDDSGDSSAWPHTSCELDNQTTSNPGQPSLCDASHGLQLPPHVALHQHIANSSASHLEVLKVDQDFSHKNGTKPIRIRNQSFSLPSMDREYTLLRVDDTEQLGNYYETMFRKCQQLVCKLVAKAWIKIMEPKKQTKFPYNKGEQSRPGWWPQDVRHKEPDHLMKPERLSLLMRMLRCGHVKVSNLELSTAEISSSIPADKWEVLREIYRVAREEEKFKIGEIVGSTTIKAYFGNYRRQVLLPDISSQTSQNIAREVDSLAVPQSYSTLPSRSLTPEVKDIARKNFIYVNQPNLLPPQQNTNQPIFDNESLNYVSEAQSIIQEHGIPYHNTTILHPVYEPWQSTTIKQPSRSPAFLQRQIIPNIQQSTFSSTVPTQQEVRQPPQLQFENHIPAYEPAPFGNAWAHTNIPPMTMPPNSPPVQAARLSHEAPPSSPRLPTPFKGCYNSTPGSASANMLRFSEFLEQSPMPSLRHLLPSSEGEQSRSLI